MATEREKEMKMLKHYTEKLRKALDAGPLWLPEARIALMTAVAYYMQQQFMQGKQYGAPGLPNMQTILEIGGTDAADFEAYMAAGVREWVEGTFLPWLAAEEAKAVVIDPRQFTH